MTSAWEMWDPHPYRCPKCRTILQRPGPGALGWCPEHGDILGVQFDSQDPEKTEEE